MEIIVAAVVALVVITAMDANLWPGHANGSNLSRTSSARRGTVQRRRAHRGRGAGEPKPSARASERHSPSSARWWWE